MIARQLASRGAGTPPAVEMGASAAGVAHPSRRARVPRSRIYQYLSKGR